MIKDLRRSDVFDLDASIFSSTLIIAFAGISLVSLAGFPKPEYDYYLICGLGLLLVNFSVVFKAFFNVKESPGIDAVITVTLLFLSLTTSLLPDWISSIFAFMLASVGYLCLSYVLWRSQWRFNKLWIWIITPILLSIWVAGFQYGSTFHHPLYMEKITLGVINHDQIYHTSITEIIRTYLVPSTGLNGTPYLSYHFGSHILMALFSNLLDVSALASYNVLFPVVIIALYFRVALFVIKDLAVVIFRMDEVVSDWLFWMLFIALTISVIPNDFAYERWAIWDSWIVSESYLFSLIFLLFSISLTIAIIKERSRRRQIIFSFVLMSLLFLTGLSKISVIIVGAGAGFYTIVRSGHWRSIWGVAVVLITFGIVLLIMKIATRHSISSQTFVPLHFIKEWIPQSTRVFFIPVFYFCLLVYAIVRVKEKGIRTMSELKKALQSKQFIDIEFLLVSALVGLAPALAFPIEGGSGWYFMDIQGRLALVFLGAFILYKRSRKISNFGSPKEPALSSISVQYALLSMVAIVLVLNNVFSKLEDLFNVNLKLRLSMIQLDTKESKYHGDYSDIYKYIQGDRDQVREKLSEIIYLPGKIVHNSERFTYYKWLADTCAQIENKKDYYISLRNDSVYFANAHKLNWAAPFIVPSLTGMALTNGLSAAPPDFQLYGYASYKNVPIEPTFCNQSHKKQIIIIDPYTKSMEPCK